MDSKTQNIINDLKKDDFQLPEKEILAEKKDKYSGPILRNTNKYFFYLAMNRDSDKIRGIKKEGEILQALKNTEGIPKIIQYSDSGNYLIRENIDGEISGNVYSFNNLVTEKQLFSLLNILQKLWNLKTKLLTVELFSLAGIVQKLDLITASNLQDQKKKIAQSFSLLKIDNSPKVLLHGDLQPTNILISRGEPTLFDFERAQYGPIYYDIVSLYHRYDGRSDQPEVYSTIKQLFLKNGWSYDEEIFKLFHSYYLLIDINSLQEVYIDRIKRPFHSTVLSVSEAEKLQELYLKKLAKLI
jgi:predicted Ser/Thr protein kinase